MGVIYWCAECKHIIPYYLPEKNSCEICNTPTVKLVQEVDHMKVDIDIAFQNTIKLNQRLLEIAKENGANTKEIEDNIAKAKAMYSEYLREVEE